MSIKYRGLRLVYSRAGVGSNAAVIHDFRYSKEFDQSYPGLFISRDKADEEFYDMLIYSGMSKIKAKLAYYGVRIFGKKEYRK